MGRVSELYEHAQSKNEVAICGIQFLTNWQRGIALTFTLVKVSTVIAIAREAIILSILYVLVTFYLKY